MHASWGYDRNIYKNKNIIKLNHLRTYQNLYNFLYGINFNNHALLQKNFIDQSIQSVLNQTYKKFELLIVYDDFDKEELYYLKKFVDSDDRVKIIENEKNLGAGLSRNKGIELSKGRFIAFLDSDDLWSKSKLEKQIKFMTQNNCFISHTSYEIIDS